MNEQEKKLADKLLEKANSSDSIEEIMHHIQAYNDIIFAAKTRIEITPLIAKLDNH
jgi:hypothetical protein